MKRVLIDANVLIDVFTDDPDWVDWSVQALEEVATGGQVFINPIIYAEVSIAFKSVKRLDTALDKLGIERAELPYPAAFLAGKAFLKYRQRGGKKRSPLPDFYVGAHAQQAGLTILTRDENRYRTYFPKVKLIYPKD